MNNARTFTGTRRYGPPISHESKVVESKHDIKWAEQILTAHYPHHAYYGRIIALWMQEMETGRNQQAARNLEGILGCNG